MSCCCSGGQEQTETFSTTDDEVDVFYENDLRRIGVRNWRSKEKYRTEWQVDLRRSRANLMACSTTDDIDDDRS